MKIINLSGTTSIYRLKQSLEFDEQFLFKTSGSTGVPKDLIFSKQQLKESARQTTSFFGLDPKDVLLSPLSLDYVAGKMMAVRAWHLEATLVYIGGVKDPYEWAATYPVSFAAFVPLQMKEMLPNSGAIEWLNQMKHIIIGGAPVSWNLEQEIKDRLSVPVWHTYGMTETLTHVAVRRLNGKHVSSNYQALPRVKFDVDSRQCLKVLSPVQKDWLQTNDVVELGISEFRWLGRADFVINSGGYKVHPEIVEAAILKELGIAGMAVGLPDAKLGEKVVFVTEGDNLVVTKDLRDALSGVLHPFEIPRFTQQMGSFPRTRTGKWDRQEVLRLLSR